MMVLSLLWWNLVEDSLKSSSDEDLDGREDKGGTKLGSAGKGM